MPSCLDETAKELAKQDQLERCEEDCRRQHAVYKFGTSVWYKIAD